MSTLIEVRGLKKYFEVEGIFSRAKKMLHAVDDLSFDIKTAETFGLIGESGCGKTTTGKLLLRLLEPTAGEVRFMGQDIFKLSKDDMRKLRPKMQIVFQDPLASLNPRKTVREILSQPYHVVDKFIGNDEVEDRVKAQLESVGLIPPEIYLDRFPHEFSGGQVQRIAFARATALKPKFIVADEPVSTLDVSIRARILNLMKNFQTNLNLSYIFITHDLSIARSICNRVAVMYLGKLVELSETEEIFSNPLHPYTKAILSATPIPNPRIAAKRQRIVLKGHVPSPIDLPSGCRFYSRCTERKPRCLKEEPSLIEVNKAHFVACLYA